jgi:ABC-2 type transport system permease protein
VRAQLTTSAQAAAFTVTYLTVENASAARDAVRDGHATVGLTDAAMYVRTDAPGAFPLLVAQAVVAEASAKMLHDAGLTSVQIGALAAIVPPPRVDVGPVEDQGRAALGFVVGIVLYLAILFSGTTIATNVAVEKSTRIAEILLTVLRPSQILVGNIVGIGLQTLAELLIPALAVLGALAVTDGLSLPAFATGDAALGLAWFVLGFLTYAFLYAAAAALVDKVIEVGAAIMPVTTLVVLAYLGSVTMAQQTPGSPLAVALSTFPLTSPTAMPIRWASGAVPVWQLVTSMAISAGSALLLARFGASVYRRALVITGRRAKLREVLR